MTSLDAINSAIAAHTLWKSRLHHSIDTGKSDVASHDARRDDACAFGKWLRTVSPTEGHHKNVTDLHRRFHHVVGSVLDLATAGKKAEAQKLMGADSEFSKASSQLVRELMAWKQEVS